jgi:hypothetical protein
MATHVLIKTKDFLTDVLNGDPNFHDKSAFTTANVYQEDDNWREGGSHTGHVLEKVDLGLKVYDTDTPGEQGTTLWTKLPIMVTSATGQPARIYEVDYEIAEAYNISGLSVYLDHSLQHVNVPITVGKHKVRVELANSSVATYAFKIRVKGDTNDSYMTFRSIAVREVKSVSTGDFVINIDDICVSEFDPTAPSTQLTNKTYFSSTGESVLDETPATKLIFKGPGDATGQRYINLFHDNPTANNNDGRVISSNILAEMALASESKAKVVDITDKLPLIKHIEKDS